MRLSVNRGLDAVAGQFTQPIGQASTGKTSPAISPHGARLVFPVKNADGKQMLATRLLADSNRTVLGGTENGIDPFFSPDGQWIGFLADGKMKKIAV